jgi:endoglycosylceramidase
LLTILSLFPVSIAPAQLQARPPSPPRQPVIAKPALRVTGRYFTDPAGRFVILRGVSISGGAKVPPFRPVTGLSDLDKLSGLGFNAIRLLFIWEAFEPKPGSYDDAYLSQLRTIAAAAWSRGLFVIVDFHQDGFARCLAGGSGDGFPFWAVSRSASRDAPDNGPACKLWPLMMAADLDVHRSFVDFHGDVAGVRTRYLLMLRRAAAAFADVPGVVGYDPINEPWGDERRDLGPLYRDAATAIRSVDPTAILFLEGHVTTNCGIQTTLDRPEIPNVAYAPHYYHPETILRNAWHGDAATVDRAFARMQEKAREWGVPLLLGEFGAPGEATRADEYVHGLYDRLDLSLTSGMQWNYAPAWSEHARDGWNGEDFNILEPSGRLRPNFPERPHPIAFAGVPMKFQYERTGSRGGGPALELVWDHCPERGVTEVHVPERLFRADSEVTVEGSDTSVNHDVARQVLIIGARKPGPIRVRLTSPTAVALEPGRTVK